MVTLIKVCSSHATSFAQMEQLLAFETQFIREIQNLSSYIPKSLLTEIERDRRSGTRQDLLHPTNQFKLMKRFEVDWPQVLI